MDLRKFQIFLALLVTTASFVSCKSFELSDPESLFKEYFAKLPDILRTGIDDYRAADPTNIIILTYANQNCTSRTFLYIDFYNSILEGCSQFNVSQFKIENISEDEIYVHFAIATAPVTLALSFNSNFYVFDDHYYVDGSMNFTSSSSSRRVTYYLYLDETSHTYKFNSVGEFELTFEDLKVVITYDDRSPPPDSYESLLDHVRIFKKAYQEYHKDELQIAEALLNQIQQNSKFPKHY